MGGWFSREQWHSDVTFVSLGMVVLDELRFPGKAPLLDVIGGSGAYSTIINPTVYGILTCMRRYFRSTTFCDEWPIEYYWLPCFGWQRFS